MNNRELFFKSTLTAVEKKHSSDEDEFLQFIFHKELQNLSFSSTFKSSVEYKGITVSNPSIPVGIYFPNTTEINDFIEKYQHTGKKKCYKKLITLIKMPLMFYINELTQTHELPESAILLLKSIQFISTTMDFSKSIFFKKTLHRILINLQDSYKTYLVSRIAEMKYTPLSIVENKKILSLINLTPTEEAFQLTCLFGTTEMIKIFLQNGFDVNELFEAPRRNPINITPLMNAAQEGNIDVMHILLDHKAQIDLADSDGRTALMYAALNSQLSAAKLLVEHHADIAKRDTSGSTASDLSCIYNAVLHNENTINTNEEIKKLLLYTEPTTSCSGMCLIL